MIPFQPALEYHKKILKAFRERNSQKIYELMLNHILQNQGGLKRVMRATQMLPLSSLERGRSEGKL